MKALALGLVLLVGGCADLQQVGTAVSIATTSVANPVTKQRLAELEVSANIPLTALVAYRRACIKHAADANCRSNIVAIQKYTKQIPPYITQLRAFVKNDDQINAVVVFDQLSNVITKAKQTAANFGITLGGA